MSKRKRRKFTVEQKVRILEEARAPNTTVSEVLRRHQLDETTFYRWERQAKEGAREALEGRTARNGKAADREIERLEQELEKKRRVIAEVVEENLVERDGGIARLGGAGRPRVLDTTNTTGHTEDRGSRFLWRVGVDGPPRAKSQRDVCSLTVSIVPTRPTREGTSHVRHHHFEGKPGWRHTAC